MGLPRLSPLQYAYLFHQEAFLERLGGRARRLAEDGYAVEATATPYVFRILCPKRVNTYCVHALEKTCTCPFYTQQAHDEPLTADGSIVPCKHLRGLRRLLRRTRERLLKEGRTCEAYRLWAHTMAWLSVERLRDEETATPPVFPTGTVAPQTKGEESDELSRRARSRSRR